MKKLTKLSLISIFFSLIPIISFSHPGHDQSMTFVHAFETLSIVVATLVIGVVAIKYFLKH